MVPILFEALLAWIGFKLIAHRFKFRWPTFIRYWWLGCLYLTVPGLVITAGEVILPGMPAIIFPVFGGASVALSISLALMTVWFLLVPATLFRSDVSRRIVRVLPCCPVCKYWLHNWTGRECPECGEALIKSERGGYSVDRLRGKGIYPKSRLIIRTALLSRGGLVFLLPFSIILLFIGYLLMLSMSALPPSQGILLHLPDGPAEYSRCMGCDSIRLKHSDGSVSYPLTTRKYTNCHHAWIGAIDAWSKQLLRPGGVLLIKRSGLYSAVKVIHPGDAMGIVEFEWFHHPEKGKGIFTDSAVRSGSAKCFQAITFANVDIQCIRRRIWYDFYYGGIDGATTYVTDPHQIALAGQVDIFEIDAADGTWIYKTWEDGKPAGRGSSRPAASEEEDSIIKEDVE